MVAGRSVLPLAILPAVLLGCHGSLEDRLVGTYTARFETSPGRADLQTQLQQNILNSMLTAELELRKNGTFTSNLLSPASVDGRWRLEGTTLILEPERVGELRKKADNDPMEAGLFKPLRLQVDPRTLTLSSILEVDQSHRIVLRRKEQP
ncbi:MAG: hypothetical protein ACK41F_01370 [Fimbriimonadaceae bacterium]